MSGSEREHESAASRGDPAPRRSERLHEVRIERNLLIELSDGVTLAADLHVPETSGPHPTLVSLYPYRKDDVIGSFTAHARRWFAQRGYAHLLVDVRGYGGSAGRHAESFDPRAESADAGEVVQWAGAQEWSTGAVGVWGVSYGGLMALAAATARPPALKAIAPVYPLWNVYEDIAALGNCSTMISQHQWSTIMLAQRLAPPTYRDPHGRWQRVWRERLDRLDSHGVDISRWREHPPGDEYWEARVLPVERIEVPTFLIGGWRDLFPQAVAAAYERITAPKRLLFGPWLHVPPDLAAQEPVDWMALLLGFFDEHLRAEPPAAHAPVLAFVQGGGGWRASGSWPPESVEAKVLRPSPDGALHDEAGDGADEYRATPLVGSTGGQWDAMGTGMGYPLDQGPDDLLSLTYDGAALGDGLELAGSPAVVLDVERLDDEEPFALVAKLIDLAPEGTAELITSGWAQATAGAVEISLRPTAWALPAGHRLRLSISCADFPRIWPGPSNPRIRVQRRGCELRLPVARSGWGDPVEPPRPHDEAAAERFPWTVDGAPLWSCERDLARDALTVTLGGSERMRLPEGGTFALRQRASARVSSKNPAGASVQSQAVIEIETAAGERIEVEARSRAWRDRDLFWGRVTVDGCPMIERSWRSP